MKHWKKKRTKKKQNKKTHQLEGSKPRLFFDDLLLILPKDLGPFLQTFKLKRRMAVRIFYIPVGDFGPSMLSLVPDSFASSKRETTPGP